MLVECTAKLDEIEGSMYKELFDYIGALDYFIANPRTVKKLDEHRFIVKVSLYGYEKFIRALALIRSVEGKKAAFFTLYASGTLKALSKHAFQSMHNSTTAREGK